MGAGPAGMAAQGDPEWRPEARLGREETDWVRGGGAVDAGGGAQPEVGSELGARGWGSGTPGCRSRAPTRRPRRRRRRRC